MRWRIVAQRFKYVHRAHVESALRVVRHLDCGHQRTHVGTAVEQLAPEGQVGHRMRVQIDPAPQTDVRRSLNAFRKDPTWLVNTEDRPALPTCRHTDH